MASENLLIAEDKMQKVVDGAKQDLATIRTGRASPALVEHLKVDYAGTPMPLNQIAGISVPEAQLLVIPPWDPGTVHAIEKAIMASDMGLNPNSDGKVIRIAVPPLTEVRRDELIKVVKHRIEERKIVVRNLRRDANNELKELEKNKDVSQDEHTRASADLQKITDSFIADIDRIGHDKETELKQV